MLLRTPQRAVIDAQDEDMCRGSNRAPSKENPICGILQEGAEMRNV
jgi:hypothetical protein